MTTKEVREQKVRIALEGARRVGYKPAPKVRLIDSDGKVLREFPCTDGYSAGLVVAEILATYRENGVKAFEGISTRDTFVVQIA